MGDENLDAGGAGKGSGDKTGDGKGDNKGGDASPEFDKLVKGMEALATGMTALQEAQSQTSERLALLDEKKAAGEKTGEENEDADLDTTALEGLSRTDFANNIIERVVKAVNKQIKQVEGSVEDVRRDAGQMAVETEIAKLEGLYKDFWDWNKELKELAKENPNTTLERLYNMARHENVDKAKELDKKYSDDKGGDKPKAKDFGGLTPTSSTTEDTSKMDKKSAAESAFEDTMGHLNIKG